MLPASAHLLTVLHGFTLPFRAVSASSVVLEREKVLSGMLVGNIGMQRLLDDAW